MYTHAWTQRLNRCPSSKLLSNSYSAQSRGIAMRPRRAETKSCFLPSPSPSCYLSGWSEITQATWKRTCSQSTRSPTSCQLQGRYEIQLDEENCIGAPPLSHKHANAHFGAFAQFPLHTHKWGRGREGDGAELGGTKPTHKPDAYEAEWNRASSAFNRLRNNRQMKSNSSEE